MEPLGQGQQKAHDEAHEEAAHSIHCQRSDGEVRAEAHANGGDKGIAADSSQPAADKDEKIIAHNLPVYFLLCYTYGRASFGGETRPGKGRCNMNDSIIILLLILMILVVAKK